MNFSFSYKSNSASVLKIYFISPLEFLTVPIMCSEIVSQYFSQNCLMETKSALTSLKEKVEPMKPHYFVPFRPL